MIFFGLYVTKDNTFHFIIVLTIGIPALIIAFLGTIGTLKSYFIFTENKILINDIENGHVEVNEKDVDKIINLKIVKTQWTRKKKEESRMYEYFRHKEEEFYLEFHYRNGEVKRIRYDIYSNKSIKKIMKELNSLGYKVEKIIITEKLESKY